MTRDILGVPRGRCACGNCQEYILPPEGCRCACCDCIPTKHVDMGIGGCHDSTFNPKQAPKSRDDKFASPTTHSAGFGPTPRSSLVQDALARVREQTRTQDVRRGDSRPGAPLPRQREIRKSEAKVHTTQPSLQEARRNSDSMPDRDQVKTVIVCHTQPKSHEVKYKQYIHGTALPKSHEVTYEQYTYGIALPKPQKDQPGHQNSKRLEEKTRTPRSPVPLIKMKACQVLQHGHYPYTVIKGMKPDVRGVYKIAYKWKTIYVGNPSSNVIHQLKNQFSGNGQVNLFHFIQRLSKEELGKVSVFWLDEKEYVHHCGNNSYLKCIESLQGSRPIYNCVSNTVKSARACSINISGLYTAGERCGKSVINSKVSKEESHEITSHPEANTSSLIRHPIKDYGYSAVTRTSTVQYILTKTNSFDSVDKTSKSDFTIPKGARSKSDVHVTSKITEKRRYSDERNVCNKRLKFDRRVSEGDFPSSTQSRKLITGELNKADKSTASQLTISPRSPEFVQRSQDLNLSKTGVLDVEAELTPKERTTPTLKEKIASSMGTQTNPANTENSNNYFRDGNTAMTDHSPHVNILTGASNGTSSTGASQTLTLATSKAIQTTTDQGKSCNPGNTSNKQEVPQIQSGKKPSYTKSSEAAVMAKSVKSGPSKVKKVGQSQHDSLQPVRENIKEGAEIPNMPNSCSLQKTVTRAVEHQDVGSHRNNHVVTVLDDDHDDDGKEKETTTLRTRLTSGFTWFRGMLGMYDDPL